MAEANGPTAQLCQWADTTKFQDIPEGVRQETVLDVDVFMAIEIEIEEVTAPGPPAEPGAAFEAEKVD